MKNEPSQYFLSPLQSGLQDRNVVAPYSQRNRSWQIVFLTAGELEFVASNENRNEVIGQLSAPGLLCQPVEQRRSIRLLAGSSGIHLSMDEAGMFAAVGSQPEAVELRVMISDAAALSLGQMPDAHAQIDQTLNVIEREMGTKMPGQHSIVEAQIRCLLVQIWRHSFHTKDIRSTDGPQTILLRRFRQLVESHYRERWRVSDYAKALGTSTDRLHNVATRSLGRAPLTLIHERSHREAKALLTRSNMSLEQVAAYLGFSSPAQFSGFFRKHENQPPGHYRAKHTASSENLNPRSSSSLTDWP